MPYSISRDQIKGLQELSDRFDQQVEHSSDLLRMAQDRHSDRKHKLMRDGKEIELTEKILWDEVFYLGTECEAGQILQREHPEVFESYRKQDELAVEMKKYTITELGVDFTKMKIVDYLKLTEAMFNLLTAEHLKAMAGPGGGAGGGDSSAGGGGGR